MSAHNSFTISAIDDGFKAQSHNFPTCFGCGKTEQDAIEKMERQIIYFRDNYPEDFMKILTDRKKRGLQCCCGHRLGKGEKQLGIVG